MEKEKKHWSIEKKQILSEYSVEEDKGLSTAEALKRHGEFGANRLKLKPRVRLLTILLNQVKSLVIYLLLAAIITSLFLQQYVEGFAIFLVLLVNTLIGFFTEYKAMRSLEALRKMGVTLTKVLRDSEITRVDAEEIVPGDICFFENGDIVTADIRILDSSGVLVDESTFSGESLPVSKKVGVLEESTILMDRRNMLYKGTSVVEGEVSGVVVAIGGETELGEIAKISQDATQEVSPLEKRLEILGRKLIYLTLVIAFVIALVGILGGKDYFLMLKVSIALAIAAIPEGLPIVATIALAKGMLLMVKKNALINKLSSVETLGSVTTIFTDKTGTLTENKMAVEKVELSFGRIDLDKMDLDDGQRGIFNKLLNACSLCTSEKLQTESTVGDSMEIALLKFSRLFGVIKDKLLITYREDRRVPFDFRKRLMGTVHKSDGEFLFSVKGAPEAVIAHSSSVMTESGVQSLTVEERSKWESKNDSLSREGYRVLGVAYKTSSSSLDEVYEDLVFIGLVGFRDPPRKNIEDAIKLCKEAGINPIMVTGDQAGTAEKIAEEIGITNIASKGRVQGIEGETLGEFETWSGSREKEILRTNVFSRVTPKQKLNLVKLFQKNNQIVAMTGDGVNDAPALRKADIGISMGLRGTQVANEAADMVLQDDSFFTIIHAIYQGRVIFSNIQRFIVYLLSCNISEVLIVSIASMMNLPLPLLPLQILFLNMVTDVFPALALGLGGGDPSYMKHKPRDPHLPIIEKKTWISIILYGLVITVSVLSIFILSLYYYEFTLEEALSISFLTLGSAQVLHVFNMRSGDSPIFINEVTKNPYVWGAVVLCSFLLLGAVSFQTVSEVLGLVKPTREQWLLIVFFSTIPLVIIQCGKIIFTAMNRYSKRKDLLQSSKAGSVS